MSDRPPEVRVPGVTPICYLCGAPATVRLEADYPMGCDIPAMHYETRDGLVVVTAYACTKHARRVAADLSGNAKTAPVHP